MTPGVATRRVSCATAGAPVQTKEYVSKQKNYEANKRNEQRTCATAIVRARDAADDGRALCVSARICSRSEMRAADSSDSALRDVSAAPSASRPPPSPHAAARVSASLGRAEMTIEPKMLGGASQLVSKIRVNCNGK